MASRATDRERQEGMVQAVEIAAAFKVLRRDAPGAGYMFARTLHNAGQLIDSEMAASAKVAEIDREIENTLSSNTHTSLPMLALRFVRALLLAERAPDLERFGFDAAFGDIAKHGMTYRQLRESDWKPPVTERGRAVLAKGVHTCVAALVCAVRDEGRETGRDTKEDVATLLALFDECDEAEAGVLAGHSVDLKQRLKPLRLQPLTRIIQ